MTKKSLRFPPVLDLVAIAPFDDRHQRWKLRADISLGWVGLTECPHMACAGDGRVTIDCLIRAVAAALDGCQSVQRSNSPL
jgi:hypothetical protein